MMVNLWGEKSDAALQALHLGFPIGSMLAPLVAYSFVSQEENDRKPTPWKPDYKDNSKIEFAYLIIGLSVIACGLVFFTFQALHMPNFSSGTEPERKKDLKWKQVVSPSVWSPGRPKFGISILVFMMIFYFLLVGSFFPTVAYPALYPVDSNFTTEQEATLLVSSTALAGTLSRALAIPIARHLPVHVFLASSIFGQAAMGICLAIWGIRSKNAFWIFSCLFVLFREPLWPGGYAWTNYFIVLFAGLVGIIDIGSRISYAVIGWVNGYMYTYISMESVYYMQSAFGVILFGYIICISVFALRQGSRFTLLNTPSVGNGGQESMDKTVVLENVETTHL